ncbi:MAG: citrate lyase beta subunit [Chlorobium sp.]|nr:citrate lyase beta subunit [Chlorobium sp.]
MNTIEREMISILIELKEKYGVFEIKAEFEAEGSRMDELMRLKDVTSTVGLPIILKIGGVEAVTDIYNGLALGVKGIIAPMGETAYALSKFINVVSTLVPEDNAAEIEFAFNLETITGYKNLSQMLELPNISAISGVTVGRVDLTGSMGLGRDAINTSEEVYNICREVFAKAKAKNLKTGLGGGISKEAMPVVNRLAELQLLDKFETRKVVFPVDAAKYGEDAILTAVKFELLWLKSKRRFYSRIKSEDETRIAMIESRLK